MAAWHTVSLGLTRPREILFFEIDYRGLKKLKQFAETHFKYWEIFKTKRGYHLHAYPYRKRLFKLLKRYFKTDFSMNYGKTILRTAPKFDEKTGRIVSKRPKLVCRNFDVLSLVKNLNQYKISYWCKA